MILEMEVVGELIVDSGGEMRGAVRWMALVVEEVVCSYR